MASRLRRLVRQHLLRYRLTCAIIKMIRALRKSHAGWKSRRRLEHVTTLPAQGPRRGRALLSYRNEAFVLPPGSPLLAQHTNYWQSAEMAAALTEFGFEVDVIDYRNTSFLPTKPYQVVIDVRNNLERLAPYLGPDCLKVFHIDTAHLVIHNAREAARLASILRRRGLVLPPATHQPTNQGIEWADHATGNAGPFARSTFHYAGKTIHPVPAPVAHAYAWCDDKDWCAAGRQFLWFGSNGLVHKGLDLTLEAFAGMPDLQLVVCGDLGREPAFAKAYHRELHETPNIHTMGWVEPGSERFREIANACAGIVFPSCSEGLSTSTLECLHAGLIPIVTRETGVPTAPFGFRIRSLTVQSVRNAVRAASLLPPGQLREYSAQAWDYARKNHTRERFSAEYRTIMADILGLTTHSSQSTAIEYITPQRAAC